MIRCFIGGPLENERFDTLFFFDAISPLPIDVRSRLHFAEGAIPVHFRTIRRFFPLLRKLACKCKIYGTDATH